MSLNGVDLNRNHVNLAWVHDEYQNKGGHGEQAGPSFKLIELLWRVFRFWKERSNFFDSFRKRDEVKDISIYRLIVDRIIVRIFIYRWKKKKEEI